MLNPHEISIYAQYLHQNSNRKVALPVVARLASTELGGKAKKGHTWVADSQNTYVGVVITEGEYDVPVSVPQLQLIVHIYTARVHSHPR